MFCLRPVAAVAALVAGGVESMQALRSISRAPIFLARAHASALTQLRTPTGFGRRTVPTGLAPCVPPPNLTAKQRFAFRQWCKTSHNLLQGCGWLDSGECGSLALLTALASLGPLSLELLPSSGGGSLHLTRLQHSICALCLNGANGDLLPRTHEHIHVSGRCSHTHLR